MDQVVRYDDLVYLNETMSLFAVENNRSNSRVVTSSTHTREITKLL